MKTKIMNVLISLLAVSVLLTACGSPKAGYPAEVPVVAEAAPEKTAVAESTADTVTESDDAVVTASGVWSDAELDSFLAMAAPFEERTGIDIQFEETHDYNALLTLKIQSGNPPDVAALPNLGAMRQYAAQGILVPLDDVLDMPRIETQYPQGLLDLAMVDGNTYGIFIKTSVKSLVWYRPDVFREHGWQVPVTWEELDALEQEIIAETGATPWCIGLESGAADGWPGTDWIEDIMLRTAGPQVFDQWWQHQIPWDAPASVAAWEAWGAIANDPQMSFGGAQYVINTQAGHSPFPMFDEEPGCYLHKQGSFITTYIQTQFPEVQLGENLNFFSLPAINEGHGNPLLVAGDLFGLFNDTPQARAFMEYLTTPEAQQIWAARGGYIAPNQAVPTDVYPDDMTRQVAQLYVEAETVRFDASDLLPQAVQDAFFKGVLQYVQDPNLLQSILGNIETVAQEVDDQ